MANELDELTGPVNESGQDVNVINKQIPTTVNKGSTAFQVVLWIFIIPGLIFLFMKIGAKNYFQRLQQGIQGSASEIDNYLEQKVQILQNVARLVEKSIDLDKDVMKSVAAYRGGFDPSDDLKRNEVFTQTDLMYNKINVALENYPELKAQNVIQDAMQQNDYLQREITAARSNYNDKILRWNQDIQVWPTKRIVAAQMRYTTRIPFSVSKEVKEKASEVFF